MDLLQNEGDLGKREINHHGMKVAVDTAKSNKLFSKRDDTTSNVDYLELSQLAARKGIPIVITTFSVVYWAYGLYFYFYPSV